LLDQRRHEALEGEERPSWMPKGHVKYMAAAAGVGLLAAVVVAAVFTMRHSRGPGIRR